VTDRTHEDAWAPLVKSFVDDHYASLRGRVRTHVIDEHLREHMGAPMQRVVDVGGGAGDQSVPLARRGHQVTIVDPSAAMLERAATRLAREPEEVARRVTLVRTRGEDAPRALDGATFDAVLCHGVLMYLDDPEPLVQALCELTGPAGLVSIVAKNRQVNGLGIDTRGDRIDDLSGLLARRGIEPVAWYGVRLFTDGWTPDRSAADPEELVLQAELIASQRDPYRRLSRLFHLIGRRSP
jgi:S-adenosylmethionine-dependent methyltransferase